MLSLLLTRMLSGAFTLIGPYSWHLFKERISWMKAPLEPKERTSHPHWQRSGTSVFTAGDISLWPAVVYTSWEVHVGPKLLTMQESLVLLWKFQVPDAGHHTYLWPYIPLPIDLLNKPQFIYYLKSITNNSIYYPSKVSVTYDNVMF